MAKLSRRRRRSPRPPGEGDGALRVATPTLSARSARIGAGLRATRDVPFDLSQKHEGEADAIAERAVSGGQNTAKDMTAGPAPAAQAKAAPSPPAGGAAPSGSPGGQSANASPSALGPGRPMAEPVRAKMASAIGPSFRDVRIADSPAAAAATQRLGAAAITAGRTIGFAPGAYRPGTPAGDHLLAHELVHTVQQSRAKPTVQMKPKDAVKHGDISVHGGRINDETRLRTNVIVREGQTLSHIAAKLLPLFLSAEPSLTEAQRAVLSPEIKTADGLAKALLVYHQYYLRPPTMPVWRAGLRLPLPMRRHPKTDELIVNLPLAALWLKSYDTAWDPALTLKAGKAKPQSALTTSDSEDVAGKPSALGALLAPKAMTNAEEALPLFKAQIAGKNAGPIALAVADQLTVSLASVLQAQEAGRAIVDLLRAAINADKATLEDGDKAAVTRALIVLKPAARQFDRPTRQDVKLAYDTQKGNHCMTAAYMGIEQLYGPGTRKATETIVAEKDAADRANLNHIITMMKTMRELGHAGAPTSITFNKKTRKFDKDPEKEIADTVRSYGKLGFYFFGLSVMSGYHSIIIAAVLRSDDTVVIYLLDQSRKSTKENVAGEFKSYLERTVEKILKKNPRYSPLRTDFWPLYPPSNLVITVD